MRIRKKFGDKNTVGATIVAMRTQAGIKQKELAAQMQVKGIDINLSSLSKLEGQDRIASAEEIKVIAEIFGVSIEMLFNKKD